MVNTAHETKATFNEYSRQLSQSSPEPSEALKGLRNIARSYSFFIPGARGYVDAFFDDIEAIHKKHSQEVDSIIAEAYSELKEAIGSDGLTVTSAQKTRNIFQKHAKRLGDLVGDATDDILNNHPALKEKVGGNIDELKQMGDRYGPEAKKQIDETYHQIGDILKKGISASTIPQVQSLVQDKVQKVQGLGSKRWDQNMEKAKPYLDKFPQAKKLIDDNKERLKQGNAQELFGKIKNVAQSGNTDTLEEYVRKTANQVSDSTSDGGGGGLEQYLSKIPGGDEIFPQLTTLYQIAQNHGGDAENISNDTVKEIEDLLKKKVGEAQDLAKQAKEKGSKP